MIYYHQISYAEKVQLFQTTKTIFFSRLKPQPQCKQQIAVSDRERKSENTKVRVEFCIFP